SQVVRVIKTVEILMQVVGLLVIMPYGPSKGR
ncbi:MAG: hypothetical protein ACI96P_000812, partial [Candidatus Azotimanducaceae bacterium]